MKIAFLFPGQGSQTLGMGKDIFEKFEDYRKIYDKVKEITKIDIAKITFEEEEKLNETKYTQLAILTNSLAILEVLKKYNIYPYMTAGLSLGEYTALIEGNVFSFEDGIKIVQKRGEYMQNLAPKGSWKMAAIMGMSENEISKLCAKTKSGFVKPSNYNYEGQIVISGEEKAIKEATIIAKEMGAKKVRILNTSGPFHTEKLLKSSEALKEELNKYNINKIKTKIFKNIDGNLYLEKDDIKDILVKHIIKPVKFSKIIDNMLKNGIDTFIEIGPGKTLSGFLKRTKKDREIEILNINSLESLEKTIKYIKENK